MLIPMTTGRSLRLFFAAAALWAATACGPTLMATRPDVRTPGAARVVLKEVDDDNMEFVVYNESPYEMVVNRDAVRLATAAGLRNRIPGGIATEYRIPPGGSHDVHVKFPLGGLREGETVWINFQEALFIGGQMVPVEPVALVVK